MRRTLFDLALHCARLPGGRLMTLAGRALYAPYCKTLHGGLVHELDLYEWTQLELATGGGATRAAA